MKFSKHTFLLCILVASCYINPSIGCGEQFLVPEATGHSHRNILAEAAGEHWNYNRNGADWAGTCHTGKSQSPTAFSTVGTPPTALSGASFQFGVATGLKVINTGHAIQVEWLNLTNNAARVPSRGMWGSAKDASVSIIPFQFHMHSTCEHIVDSYLCPLELHLVTRVDKTAADSPEMCKREGVPCLAVFGVNHGFTNSPTSDKGSSSLFAAIVKNLPKKTGLVNAKDLPIASLDLAGLLPGNSSIATYSGSLTAPPCFEQVNWNVFTSQVNDLSISQLFALQQATATVVETASTKASIKHESGARTNNRGIQPMNGRRIQLFKP